MLNTHTPSLQLHVPRHVFLSAGDSSQPGPHEHTGCWFTTVQIWEQPAVGKAVTHPATRMDTCTRIRCWKKPPCILTLFATGMDRHPYWVLKEAVLYFNLTYFNEKKLNEITLYCFYDNYVKLIIWYTNYFWILLTKWFCSYLLCTNICIELMIKKVYAKSNK